MEQQTDPAYGVTHLTTSRRMPRQRPGRSKQDVGTPQVFVDAVLEKFGKDSLVIDLAASAENTITERYFDEATDSLAQDWTAAIGGGRFQYGWLNPPFEHIEPWVEKASRVGQRVGVLVLVPASTGANWWKRHVDGKAQVYFLNGRITFDGHTKPYPKDCALLEYAPWVDGGYCIWPWKQ